MTLYELVKEVNENNVEAIEALYIYFTLTLRKFSLDEELVLDEDVYSELLLVLIKCCKTFK